MDAREAEWKEGWPDCCLLYITFKGWRVDIQQAQPHLRATIKAHPATLHRPRPYEG
jgi:hypothetical protein